MKTAEIILIENLTIADQAELSIHTKDRIVKAMKEYADHCIRETIEIADAHAEDGCFDKEGALVNALNLLK